MRVLTKRGKHLLNLVVIVAGLMGLLVFPLSPGGAAGPARAVGRNQSSSDLGKARTRALRNLYSQLEGGSPFAEEEIAILRRFNAGDRINQLEADTVISRALHDFYVAGSELNRQQQELLGRYTQMVAPRGQDVADLKTRLLERRRSAAAAASRGISPLAAPPNDLCSGGEVIPPAGPFPYLTAVTADITDATTAGDPPFPSCQTNVSRSIWYLFTPSVTATYTISTCALDGTATTVDDTVMAIYTSSNGTCGGALNEIPKTDNTDGCGDDECIDEALQAVIRTQLTAGTPYFIGVWEFDPTAPTAGNTAVQLKIFQNLPPANDTCAGAVALTLNTPASGTLEFANDNYRLSGAPCFTGVGNVASAGAGRDVVYSFTAPTADTYSIRVTGYVASSLSNVVVYTAGSCPAAGGSPVIVSPCLSGANRGVDTTAEEIFCQALASSQQIFIFVDEHEFTTAGPFTIEVTRCAHENEPNDTPATANALSFGIEGSINPAGDVDFFSLGSPAVGSRVFALADGVAGNSSDFDMRVTTSTDTLEYDDSNADVPFGFISPSVAGTMLTGAPAFLRISQFSVAAAEPYRLYAILQPPSATATPESEPNDTTGTADSAPNKYFSGSLSGPAPSTDTDVFSFAASAGDLIFLSLDADPVRDNTPINAALALLDSGGTQLISVNDGGAASSTSSGSGSLTAITPSSPSEALVFRAAAAGTYYARVTIGTSSSGATGAGDYLLSVATVTPLSCSYSIAPTSQSFSSTAGTGTATVTANPGCAWTAVSNNPSFITITSGGAGTGNGTVNYSVALNSACAARTGTMTIAGQTFTVTQAAANCGTDTAGLYNPTTSTFFLRNSNSIGVADVSFAYGPAGAGWTPVVGDWNGGDGIDTPGLYNPATGAFFLRNLNSIGVADLSFSYGPGGLGWIPLVGDWNGDGVDTIGLYNPATGGFFLRNSNSTGVADMTFSFGPGGLGWIPLTGDWNGDGFDTVGLYNPATGGFFLKDSNSTGVADVTFSFGPGGLGWKPLVGDWDGDGVDTVGLYNPTTGGFFLKNANSFGVADVLFSYGPGGLGWLSLAGDWNGL